MANINTTSGRYKIEAATDGSGEWLVTLPKDCTFEDLEALAPVIDEMRKFIAPTLDKPVPFWPAGPPDDGGMPTGGVADLTA